MYDRYRPDRERPDVSVRRPDEVLVVVPEVGSVPVLPLPRVLQVLGSVVPRTADTGTGPYRG